MSLIFYEFNVFIKFYIIKGRKIMTHFVPYYANLLYCKSIPHSKNLYFKILVNKNLAFLSHLMIKLKYWEAMRPSLLQALRKFSDTNIVLPSLKCTLIFWSLKSKLLKMFLNTNTLVFVISSIRSYLILSIGSDNISHN